MPPTARLVSLIQLWNPARLPVKSFLRCVWEQTCVCVSTLHYTYDNLSKCVVSWKCRHSHLLKELWYVVFKITVLLINTRNRGKILNASTVQWYKINWTDLQYIKREKLTGEFGDRSWMFQKYSDLKLIEMITEA